MLQEKSAPSTKHELVAKGAEAKQEAMYLTIAVFGILLLVSTLMVRILSLLRFLHHLTPF